MFEIRGKIAEGRQHRMFVGGGDAADGVEIFIEQSEQGESFAEIYETSIKESQRLWLSPLSGGAWLVDLDRLKKTFSIDGQDWLRGQVRTRPQYRGGYCFTITPDMVS
jgi:hypothetical protein